MPTRLYSLYKIGSNESELQGIQEKRKKRKTRTPTIHKIKRKGGHSENLRRQLIEEKTHHDAGTMITRNSAGHGSGGTIQLTTSPG
jgi:hypothetical protein